MLSVVNRNTVAFFCLKKLEEQEPLKFCFALQEKMKLGELAKNFLLL
jgi:hypothetical protein